LLFPLSGQVFRFDLDHLVPTEKPQRKRKLSREGLLLIKSFEGFRPRAVHRRDGTLGIGYGHTLTARHDVEITELEAELLLLHDLIPIVDYIHREIRRPLNQNQFDALVSFIFNIGLERVQGTSIPSLIRKGQMVSAAEALSSEPDRKPPPTDLPYRRRCAERALFEAPPSSKPDLGTILCAPVSRPGPEVSRAMEAPLGETGVVRHELPQTPPRTSRKSRKTKPAKRGHAAPALLLALLGLGIGAGTVAAFKYGVTAAGLKTHSLLIGTSLSVLGLLLLGLALWAYRSSRPGTKSA